jgi:hypothetical protein
MKVSYNEKGFWENDTTVGHHNDEPLCNVLVDFLKDINVETLLDLGCGPAYYVKNFTENGIKCEAYDGNPNTPLLTEGLGQVKDLSEEFNLGKTFDFVLSLEVGEHIPQKYEDVFINNVLRHSHNYVLLSWAVPGQTGDGHVNERTNEHIVSKITSLGFTYIDDVSARFRSAAQAHWFKNTLMLFKKK